MGANAQVKMSSRTQYSRYLGDFRGVDFSSSPAMVAQNRFSYLKNMWKDCLLVMSVRSSRIPIT